MPVQSDRPDGPGHGPSAIREPVLAFTGSLGQAVRSVCGSDRPGGGELVERLAISRTLAWRIQQMVKPDDVAANLNAIVGERGFRVMVAALEAAGAPRGQLDEIERRWKELRASMKQHRIDRDELRAIGVHDAVSDRARSDATRLRRAAMRANETLWGVGIHTTVVMQMFAPPSDPPSGGSDRIGLAASVMDHGLRVLRPVPPLVVYQRPFSGVFDGSGAQSSIGADPSPWMEAASTPGLFGNSVVACDHFDGVFRLDARLVPPSAPNDLTFAEYALDFASPYGDAPGDSGFFEAPLGLPVERVIAYLGTHTSMPEWTGHECGLRTSPLTSRRLPPERRFARLPLEIRLESVESVGGTPALPPGSESLEDRIRTVTSINADRLGHPPSSFRFMRAVVDFPPMPSFMFIRWRLAERPA